MSILPGAAGETAGHPLIDAFHAFIGDAEFPCVGAKSALARGQMRVLVARDLTSAWNDLPIHSELHAFAQRYKADPRLFQSVAIIFEGPDDLNEEAFERHLWARVQSLTDKDVWHGSEVDPRVDVDPGSPHFSLSFGGEAFFVVGLHPNASRAARRFQKPVMVFNLHDQFERLRRDGLYEKLRDAILQRDVALDGSTNPMLARHGELSEARQYSGRAVNDDWRCPLSRATPVDGADDLAELMA